MNVVRRGIGMTDSSYFRENSRDSGLNTLLDMNQINYFLKIFVFFKVVITFIYSGYNSLPKQCVKTDREPELLSRMLSHRRPIKTAVAKN